MAEEKPKSSAIVSEGAYQLDRRPLWVRPAILNVEVSAEEAERLRRAEEGLGAEAVSDEPVPTEEEKALRQAERIIGDAKKEAEDLKRRAHEEGFSEGLREGHERGREQGFAEGRAEALKDLQETMDRWMTMGDSLTEAWRTRFQGLDSEIKDLAVAIAEKLVQMHLEVKPEAVVEVVRESLRHAAEAEQVTVVVCAKDVGMVRAAKEELTSVLRGSGRFEVAEDPKVEPGSCIIETKTQVIDATRKTRTERTRDGLRSQGDERTV